MAGRRLSLTEIFTNFKADLRTPQSKMEASGAGANMCSYSTPINQVVEHLGKALQMQMLLALLAIWRFYLYPWMSHNRVHACHLFMEFGNHSGSFMVVKVLDNGNLKASWVAS